MNKKIFFSVILFILLIILLFYLINNNYYQLAPLEDYKQLNEKIITQGAIWHI